MKKIFCIFISVVMILVSLVSCTSSQNNEKTTGEKEDIFAEKDDEKTLEDASSLSFYKEFLGGTGYKVDSSTASHYEYDGGEMSVDFAIDNQASEFECGLMVALNGVFQPFTLKNPDGKVTDEGCMQKVQIPEKEKATFTLSFTPNIGKKGDTLNLSVGTLTEPSFTSVYSGWPRYAKYGQHNFSGASAMTVVMNRDGTGTKPSEKVKISETEITDEYFELVTAAEENDKKNEAWKNNYAFALYYDKYDLDRDLIAVPETDSVNLKLDALGKAATYRISFFVNNEIVKFENDRTYFELQNTSKKVTHAEFPVDISDIPSNSNIYAIVAEKDNEKSSPTFGMFIPIYKTCTYYFIKGEVPEVTSETETDVTAEDISKQNSTANITEGKISALNGMEVLYVSSVGNDTMCFVVRDEGMNKKALFLNKDSNTVTAEVALGENAMYYSVVGGRLVVADNTKTENGAYTAIDKSGKTIDKKPYVIKSAAEKESKFGFSMLSGALKRVAIDPNTCDMVYLAYDETYYIANSTGKKTRLDFLSKDKMPTQVKNLSGGNILTSSTNDNGSTFTLTDLGGNKIGEFSFHESKDLTCVGNYAVVFTQKNLTGISSDDKINILNCSTGEMKELTAKTNTENQWCTISSDAKYILTLDNDSLFRLYDTEKAEVIESFKANGTDAGLFEYQVFIDSVNKSIYFQTNENDVYGVYVKKF